MTISHTDEQRMLSDAVARLARSGPADMWRALADELGVMGIGIAERSGGLGGGAADAGVVAVALGRALAPLPWFDHWVACKLLAENADGRDFATGVASGDMRPVLALHSPFDGSEGKAAFSGDTVEGRIDLLRGAVEATHLLVPVARPSGIALRLIAVDAPGVTLVPRPMIDGVDAADIRLEAVPVAEMVRVADGDAAAAWLYWASDALTVGRCAQAAGFCRMMLDDTLEYARTREQFGGPIGRFQVLRHRMVDMLIALEKADVLLQSALRALDGDAGDRVVATSAAKVGVDEAIRVVGEGAVQLHGAMGITEELPVGVAFKRAVGLARLSGSRALHLRRYAEMTVNSA